jgi:hypothetical protein
VEHLFERFDTDFNGVLDAREFVELAHHARRTSSSTPPLDLHAALAKRVSYSSEFLSHKGLQVHAHVTRFNGTRLYSSSALCIDVQNELYVTSHSSLAAQQVRRNSDLIRKSMVRYYASMLCTLF